MATPSGLPAPVSAELAKRWLALAEQRRDNFIELYETGRWQRYYTEEQFLQRMKQAMDLIDAWKGHAAIASAAAAEPFMHEPLPLRANSR